MTNDTVITFLNGYLQSLKEETREVKGQLHLGFDHIILKLAEANGLIPLRLAYHRGGRKKAPKPKKEAEYGEDLKVISHDRKCLTVFVLKDEALTYKNWLDHGFFKDMSLAVSQDMLHPDYIRISSVKVVLVYNKDEDARGVEAYTRFINSQSKKIGDSAKLSFDRWNLTELTKRVHEKLIGSPALLPEQYFRAFSYICWQVEECGHGSDQWREIMIPDWRKFLSRVLIDSAGEREIRMISVALMIVQAHGKAEPSWETGWIEMLEWAMLALWRLASRPRSKKNFAVVHRMWIELYLTQLEEYYARHADLLAIEDSLSCGGQREFQEAVGSHHAYWHMARLGILGLSCYQISSSPHLENTEEKRAVYEAYKKALNCLVGMVKANTACRRPMLDIHHIQLCMVWLLLAASNRNQEVLRVFGDIHERLVLRRRGQAGVRIIDQHNSWPILLEFIASGEVPDESFGKSSYLLQMLIEICVCKLGEEGEALGWAFYQHLIRGCIDEGESMDLQDEVQLKSWVPPEKWLDKVLIGSTAKEGISVSVEFFGTTKLSRERFGHEVRSFVEASRKEHPDLEIQAVPFGVAALACVLHDSPLPPEVWRSAFEEKTTSENHKGPPKKKRAKASVKRAKRKDNQSRLCA